MAKAIVLILIIISCIAADFGFVAMLTKIICWAFNIVFTWKLAIGVWAIQFLIYYAFFSNRGD